MQDIPVEDLAYLRSQIDLKDSFSFASWDGSGADLAPLQFDFQELAAFISEQLEVAQVHDHEDAIEIDIGPGESFRLITILKDRSIISTEGLSAREFYRFAKGFIELFPQSTKPYIVTGDIAYAWLRTDLPEEEAIINMLAHDDQVREALGLPEYDHSQW